MKKVITATEAAAMIKDGSRIANGGFLATGAPETIIDAIVKQGTKNLHMIVIASDWEDRGVGKLVVPRAVSSAQVSHLGTNKAIQAQMNAGEMAIELIPQGTLMERVRALASDFAIIRAHKADRMGNLTFRKTARNSNPIMAMAGKITIVEVDEIVEIGALEPDDVACPGIFVNYLVKTGEV